MLDNGRAEASKGEGRGVVVLLLLRDGGYKGGDMIRSTLFKCVLSESTSRASRVIRLDPGSGLKSTRSPRYGLSLTPVE
ncbi:unnamed protein product [Merluccius merluccius]